VMVQTKEYKNILMMMLLQEMKAFRMVHQVALFQIPS